MRGAESVSGDWTPTRGAAALAAAFVLLLPVRSAAQTVAIEAFDVYLRSGPTFSALFSVQHDGAIGRYGGLFRVGSLAGLPVQFEATFPLFPVPQDRETASAIALGVRVLPLSFQPGLGLRHGGTTGHNLGLLGGLGVGGWYFGAAYEWLIISHVGITADYVFVVGSPLALPPTLNFGIKLQIPAF